MHSHYGSTSLPNPLLVRGGEGEFIFRMTTRGVARRLALPRAVIFRAFSPVKGRNGEEGQCQGARGSASLPEDLTGEEFGRLNWLRVEVDVG